MVTGRAAGALVVVRGGVGRSDAQAASIRASTGTVTAVLHRGRRWNGRRRIRFDIYALYGSVPPSPNGRRHISLHEIVQPFSKVARLDPKID
ncbi:hypothetical protein GCM10010989_16560 [Croceicoccus pelagius]|uniref:Uncharacterized protein n=1 Tax=Croceicoccus pelagius TaxID=1703341 RepID=A0A917DIR3_9SPHN|nr:hypothetical protein GCM10010989_16560 [Croceicoccus pelagius]